MCGFYFYFNKNGKKLSSKQISNLKIFNFGRGTVILVLYNNNCYFFHNRLKIIDLNNDSNQPMVCKKTGNIIIFNGESYNFNYLNKYLRDYKFYTNSDTEVILHI